MKILLKATARIAEKLAKISAETTSWAGMYQPKTPVELKKVEQNKNEKS